MDLINLLTSPTAIAVLAASAAVFFICLAAVGRSRRQRRIRQAKEQARECLMQARRAARSPREADLVPGLVRRIHYLAEKTGFELHDVGASRRALDKLLMMARDKTAPVLRPSYQNIGPIGLALEYNRLTLPGPNRPAGELELDLAPDEAGANMVITLGSTEAAPAQQTPDAFGNSLEIEIGLPELGPEVILDSSVAADGTPAGAFDNGVEIGPELPELGPAIIVPYCTPAEEEKTVQGTAGTSDRTRTIGPDDENDVDVDALFDRIIIRNNGTDANANIVHIVKGDA
jgi:hypothetical protein